MSLGGNYNRRWSCTLCGQVCPTGAIENIPLMKKQPSKIGHAYLDKNICLPHAKAIPCIACEEHCPTPKKAIKFRIYNNFRSK